MSAKKKDIDLLEDIADEEYKEEEILIGECNPVKRIAIVLEEHKPGFDIDALPEFNNLPQKYLTYFFIPPNFSVNEAKLAVRDTGADGFLNLMNLNSENPFKIGARIRMNKLANDAYGITREKSEGSVVKLLDNGEMRVEFDVINGERVTKQAHNVNRRYADLIARCKFNIGDKIVMNKLANDQYNSTREGSEGVIVEIREASHYVVKFSKVTGRHDRNVFEVLEKYMTLVNSTNANLDSSLVGMHFPNFFDLLAKYGNATNGHDNAEIHPALVFGDADAFAFIAAQKLCQQFPLISEKAHTINSFDGIKKIIEYTQLKKIIKDKNKIAELGEFERIKTNGPDELIEGALSIIYPNYFNVAKFLRMNKLDNQQVADARKAVDELFPGNFKSYEKIICLSELVDDNLAKNIRKIFSLDDAYRDFENEFNEIKKIIPDFNELFKHVVYEYFKGKYTFRDGNFYRDAMKKDYSSTEKLTVKNEAKKYAGREVERGNCYCKKKDSFKFFVDGQQACMPISDLEILIKIDNIFEDYTNLNQRGYENACLDFSYNLGEKDAIQFEAARKKIEAGADFQKINFEEYMKRKNYLEIVSGRLEKFRERIRK